MFNKLGFVRITTARLIYKEHTLDETAVDIVLAIARDYLKDLSLKNI